MSDILLFSFALVDTGALIFILVFFIITLSGSFHPSPHCPRRLPFPEGCPSSFFLPLIALGGFLFLKVVQVLSSFPLIPGFLLALSVPQFLSLLSTVCPLHPRLTFGGILYVHFRPAFPSLLLAVRLVSRSSCFVNCCFFSHCRSKNFIKTLTQIKKMNTGTFCFEKNQV